MLLADHMPFAGAAAELAAAFDFLLINGFVVDPDLWDPSVFHRADGTLADHPITRGRRNSESIDSVGTFIGSAFTAEEAKPLMVLGSQYVSYNPTVAWEINEGTPVISVAGMLQGALKRIEKGRIAVFSDATMFSAQIGTPDMPRLGMNTPQGHQNLQFLLNVLHWLSELLEDS